MDSKIVPVSSIAPDGWGPKEGRNATSPLHSRGHHDAHAMKRGFKDCPGFLNSTGQNWPTWGQTGYVTPAVSGIPTAIELGGRIRIGPLVGKVAT